MYPKFSNLTSDDGELVSGYIRHSTLYFFDKNNNAYRLYFIENAKNHKSYNKN